jgi:hypothetical protein
MTTDRGPIPCVKRMPLTSGLMALAERLRFGEVYAPHWAATDGLVPLDSHSLASFRAMLDEAELIEASELCEFFYAGTDQEKWSIERDFPKLGPPFPVFWIEMKKPSGMVSQVTGVRPSDCLPDRMGFLFQRATTEQGKKLLTAVNPPVPLEIQVEYKRWLAVFEESIRKKEKDHGATAWQYFTKAERSIAMLVRHYEQKKQMETVLNELPAGGCSCWVNLFIQAGDRVLGPMGFWLLFFGSDGKTLFHSHIMPHFVTEDTVPDFDHVNGLDSLLNPALFALYRLLYGMATDLLEAIGMNKN